MRYIRYTVYVHYLGQIRGIYKLSQKIEYDNWPDTDKKVVELRSSGRNCDIVVLRNDHMIEQYSYRTF
jgi:hypothetical protein